MKLRPQGLFTAQIIKMMAFIVEPPCICTVQNQARSGSIHCCFIIYRFECAEMCAYERSCVYYFLNVHMSVWAKQLCTSSMQSFKQM